MYAMTPEQHYYKCSYSMFLLYIYIYIYISINIAIVEFPMFSHDIYIAMHRFHAG